ncbi:hypothetical protein BV22DRAFT_1040298 [Leucogyrophana mollusca]|uniref:Uncharacterized protein n=1 Tax=Leucogyrophana mollusca TaxID=85980 RepID=A0ACB8B300_9AGAM|nr:hypothetical protein BV22DRAFT_1040298 [Leucogyrophana mollusca]
MAEKVAALDSHEKDIDELDDDFEEPSDPNVFRIANALPPPSAVSYSARDLHTLIHQGAIDLNPVYQRGVVWPERKQIGLIDSMFRNFFVPPVVFAVQIEDGEEVRVCVDGKQRLTSIQKFIDGLIPHRDAQTKKSFWFTRTEQQKATRMEIPEDWKRRFADTLITCVEYRGIAPGTERDIFQRVQLGMSLTAAEKLQAISSPWAEWISDLEARHVLSDQGLAEVLEWDTTRGRDFQCIAQLVYCCDGLPDQLLPTAQKLEKWLTRVDSPPPTFKTQMNDVLSAFWHIASNRTLNAAFVKVDKRVAPVEFVFIGVLLYVLRNHSDMDRAKAILCMRLRIREQFVDVRNNAAVGRALWNYINSVTGPQGLKVLDFSSSGAPGSTSKSKKRRYDSDEDEDYRPSPVKSLGQGTKTRSHKAGRKG